MERVVLYARVSSEMQARARTIEEQRYAAQQWAAREGIQLQAEYLDDAKSGMLPIMERPGGSQLVKDAAAKRFDKVMVYALDRLGRDEFYISWACHVLTAEGVAVRSLTENFDDTPAGRFLRTVLGGAADYAHKQMLARLAGGRRRAARESRVSGGIRPYGYVVVNQRLVPDENPMAAGGMTPAGVIRQIYAWLVDDRLSINQIAGRLNTLGVPTHGHRRANSSGKWHPATVWAMVTNSTYKGQRQYDRGREVIVSEVPALVDAARWDQAQAVMAANRKFSPRNSKRLYSLKGLVRCGLCGQSYMGFVKINGPYQYAYYRCYGSMSLRRTARMVESCCTSGIIRARLLEDTVWAEVVKLYQDPAAVIQLAQERYAEGEGRVAQLAAEMGEVAGRLERVAEQRQKAFTLFLEGVMIREDLEAQIRRLDGQAAQVQEEVDRLEKALARERDVEARLAGVERQAQDIGELLRGPVDDMVRTRVFRELIEVVRVWTVGKGKGREVHVEVVWGE